MTRALVTTKKGKQKMKDVAIDPFEYVMIASVCMGTYNTKYLQEGETQCRTGVEEG